MLFFFRRRPKPDPDDIVEESWKTDFRKPANSRFQPEGGDGYTVSVERGSVDLRLSRRNLFAWAEDPLYRYRDFSLSGTFSFLEGAYASAGFIFRYVDPSTFYYCLVSNRGFFRLDGVFNGSPFTLIPWTPVPEPLGERFSLRIIVLDTRILVAIEEAWAAEIEDDRIDAGRVGFACQNYDQSDTAALRLMELDIDSRPVSAAALFERWSEYIPVDPAARIRLAENLYAAGQPLGAVVQLKKALREGTLAPEGYFLLAESFLGLGMLDEASRSVEKAAEAAPENEQYQMEKGNLLYLRNEFGRLAPFAEELRNRFPENHLAWNLSGHASYHGGDWDGAYRYYGEAWKLEGELPLYGANSARSAVMSGKTEEGMRLYGEAASACFRQEAYEECADLIAAAEKAAPLTPVLLSLKGKILFQKGELIEASAIFNRLVKRKEADSSIHFLLGLTQCAGEEREKGIRHLKKAAEMDPDVPVYWYKLAENLHLSGKNPEKELERALELAPGDCWVYNLKGLVERERGNGKGLEFFAKAHELCPGETDILINYSQALFENGSAAEAFTLLETGGDSPEIRNQKGNLLFASGKYEEAAAEYEEALKQAPENRTYMENAAEAAARNGSISRAAAASKLRKQPRRLNSGRVKAVTSASSRVGTKREITLASCSSS